MAPDFADLTQLAEPAAPSRGRSLRVLLVEDNAVNQIYGEAVLQQICHSVAIASDGQQAVRMASAERYDIILMDCQMPVQDGYEATRLIRRRELERGEPRRRIVALTASAMADDHRACLEAGMDQVLVKPFSVEAMAELLELQGHAAA